ncbi:tRNA1(Val) (adenine(37)-N6)-methyltransferase [Belnapia sp. F-4-1]|uniref:tRNA1(Val) (adenine(37)-N6)-methyltransferase n=1 Tax=Belnapia sp. F-4-1 TaxID=1545443 RepID=UPI0005BBFCE9|nr:methyltransferase domain-containing protein [Belnapia sp. F-4-1]
MSEDRTEDLLLGGRVRLHQLRRGLRAGLDAVLLAAGIPARPGQVVLEAGCGSGAAFLCLAARVPGLRIVALERDAGLAALARENAAAAGLAAEVIEGDVRDRALARRLPPCDHAFANPPFWPGGTPPPEPGREVMTHATGEAAGLGDWARFLAAPLARRGTLSLILPAARLDAGMAALAGAGCAGTLLLPFWPREGVAARRVLLQARRESRGPARIAPGLVLHGPGEGFSPAAEAVLRDAAALDLS